MSPEGEVRSWWNGLDVWERWRVGCLQYWSDDPTERAGWAEYWDWSADWDFLVPMGQQMRVHMYFDELSSAR
jgi:hypothetical protein